MRWWEMIAERFRAPGLMERMFARFGVQEKIVEGEEGARLLQGAAFRCVTCGEISACQTWLEQVDTLDEPPSYCRNAMLIQRLRQEADTLH